MVTILVVDDSQSLRKIVGELLNPLGVKVIEASNGIEAQKRMQETTPDLVITDLVMPQMNGYQLCRWIKNNTSTRNIPVVICSTKSEDHDRYWGMKQGADAYLIKPFEGIELLKTIQYILRNNSSVK